MVSRSEARVTAYHGTTASIGREIRRSRSFKGSLRLSNWLGDGTYFWEGDFQRALEWARPIAQKRAENAIVIEVSLRLGKCLDLTQRRHLEDLRDVAEALETETTNDGGTLPMNVADNHAYDCALINRACKDLGEFDTVRAAFQDGDLIAEHSAIRVLSHIQIAVRNEKVIDKSTIRGTFTGL